MPRALGGFRPRRRYDVGAGMGLLRHGPVAGHLPARERGVGRLHRDDQIHMGRSKAHPGRRVMSGVQDLPRLRALLGIDAWKWWRDRVRAELEAGRPIPATITHQKPTEAEREAANR